MSYFTVDILTPSRILAKDIPADSLLIPTVNGEINVLPDHTHVISQLDTGILTLVAGGNKRMFSITTGIAKVLNKKVTILSKVSEESHEINKDRAEKALAKAKDMLKGGGEVSDDTINKYQRKLSRAEMRLKMAYLK